MATSTQTSVVKPTATAAKPSPIPLTVNTEPEAVATTATSTQTSVVKSTATAAKPSPISLTVYNLLQAKVQEIPNPTIRKFQDGESPFTPNHNNPPMAQEQFKATVTATFTALLTRDNNLWPNSVLASTNLFVARSSWPIPPM